METRKEITANDIIKLMLGCGCPKAKIEERIQDLINIAYINEDFIDALFRAHNIAKSYNKIRRF